MCSLAVVLSCAYTPGHEVVNDQNAGAGGQPLLGKNQGDLFLIGVGHDLALVEAALDIVGLGLLGENHGLAPFESADGSQGDAAGLGGEDHVHLRQVKDPGEFVRQLAHEGAVYTVIQKAVNLDDTAGQNLALAADSIF